MDFEGGSKVCSTGLELRRQIFLLSHSKAFLRNLGQTRYTQSLGGVWVPTSHRAEQELRACAVSGKHGCRCSLSARAIMKMKTFLAYRN